MMPLQIHNILVTPALILISGSHGTPHFPNKEHVEIVLDAGTEVGLQINAEKTECDDV
jgi:hypothetical protein